MKRRICILLNNLNEYNFQELVHRYLSIETYEVTIAESFPDDPSRYSIIVPWNYRKVISQAEKAGNVVVLHSSNLPEGRGWAPIYHAFSEQKDEYVISGIFAKNEVDTGNVIVRARFSIEDGYTAPFIRAVDRELSLLLVSKILENWPNGNPLGVAQVGTASFRSRRYPIESQIDPSKTLLELLPHLRGIEGSCPAFFYIGGTKYLIKIRPEIQPNKPPKVIIEYPAINKVETWSDWND